MAKELVSISERRWIAENATIEMGSKIKYRVMDVDKIVERINSQRKNESMTPYIEIQPISEDMHKNSNRVGTFQKDPITGVYYGIPIDQDDFGNIRWQKIQMHDHMSLNLDKRDDARVWAVIRFHPNIQGSPWQDPTPYYKIYDPIEQARVERGEIEMMKLAFDRIDKILDDPKSMVNFVRYLGEELMDNANYEIVRGKLLMAAKNQPFDFNKKWESKTRSYGEFFESARALGIISNEADRGYIYKGISLGLNRPECIKYLSQDSAVMTSISNELSEKDIVIKNVSRTIKGALKNDENKNSEFEE
jgi:hypothetical protein